MSDENKASKADSPLSRLKALDELVAKAIEITRKAVEAGEFHLNPVYTGLRNADVSIKSRIYQIDSSIREADTAVRTASLKAEQDAAAAKKAAEDKTAAEAAVAGQKAEEAAEKERQRVLQVQRTGTTRERYMLKTLNEIQAIVAGLKVEAPKAANKGQLVNLILQKEGYQVSAEDQDAAGQGN